MKFKLFWLLLFLALLARSLTVEKMATKALYDFDEARYAEIAKNVLKTKQIFLPLAGGPDDPQNITLHFDSNLSLHPYFWKPPLHTLLMSLSLFLLGQNELAVRLPSFIFALLVLILVFRLTKIIFPQLHLAPYLAVILLASSNDFSFLSSQGIAETVLLFFELTSIYLLLKKKPLLSAASFALAFLTKSFATFWLFPLTALILLQQRYRLSKIIRYYGLLLLIILPWHIFMLAKFGPDFWQAYVINNTIGRGTGTQSNIAPIYWYLRYFLWQWWPYLIFIPLLVFQIKKTRPLLLIWSLLVFIPFSLIKSKVWWYVFPFWIPILILIASFLEPLVKKTRSALLLTAIPVLLMNYHTVNQALSRPDFNLGIKEIAAKNNLSLKGLSVYQIPYEAPLFYLDTGLISRFPNPDSQFIITNADYLPNLNQEKWQIIDQRQKTYLLGRVTP